MQPLTFGLQPMDLGPLLVIELKADHGRLDPLDVGWALEGERRDCHNCGEGRGSVKLPAAGLRWQTGTGSRAV